MGYIFRGRRRARLVGQVGFQRVQKDHTGPEKAGGVGWNEVRFSLGDMGGES